jgi:hypothetical protein
MTDRIINLPIEIFLFTRNYLLNSNFETPIYTLDRRILQENERSWRNLLSASNRTDWKAVRKNTMRWSLNRFESLKFATTKSFQEYISERTTNITLQLHCAVIPPMSTAVMEFLTTSLVGSITITGCHFPVLPSSESLHTLVVTNSMLSAVEGCMNLKFLIWKNSRTTSMGIMDSLEEFHLHYTDFIPLTTCYPLEKITMLSIDGRSLTSLVSNTHKFIKLKKLILKSKPAITHWIVSIPTLEVLEIGESLTLLTDTFGLESRDISALENLRSLNIGETTTVIGKEIIYPRLKRLSGARTAFRSFEISEYPNLRTFRHDSALSHHVAHSQSQYPQISDLTLDFRQFIDYFYVGKKVKSLNLSLNRCTKLSVPTPGRSFLQVKLQHFNSVDLAMFENVQLIKL